MRQVTKKGLITVAAAGGMLAMSGGSVWADSSADGAAEHSPGVLSGNNVQAPVNIPVNACGNTVTAVGLLNSSEGQECEIEDSGSRASGSAKGSPGVGSGNNIQVPVDVPVNACGNTVSIVGALNESEDQECEIEDSDEPTSEESSSDETEAEEPTVEPNSPDTQTVAQPEVHGQLAQTGAGSELGLGLGVGAGLLLGGTVLYRRARAAQR